MQLRLVFVCLWHRPAAPAPAPIRPLAWEPPYAAGAAQEIATTTTTTTTKDNNNKKENIKTDNLQKQMANDYKIVQSYI